MQQQLHMKLDTSLTLDALGFRQLTLLSTRNSNSFELVRMSRRVRIGNTFLALVKVCTRGTMEPVTSKDFSRACCALLDKLGSVAIVQVPKNHH